MKVKEQIKKTYTFMSRSVAIDCAKQELDKPNVENLNFMDKTWVKDDADDKYDVTVTYLETT